MNSNFVISACLNRDYYFSFFFGGGRGEGRIHSTADCALSFFGNRYQILLLLLFSYTSLTELRQSLCKVK